MNFRLIFLTLKIEENSNSVILEMHLRFPTIRFLLTRKTMQKSNHKTIFTEIPIVIVPDF